MINVTSVSNFESSYYEKWVERKGESISELTKNNDSKEALVKNALNEFIKNNDVAARVSISQEGREKLFGSNAEEAMRQGTELLYKNVNKSDVFSIREGNKWAVFNDYLKYTNAYDDIIVDEKKLTDIMDAVTLNGGAVVGEGIYTDGYGRQLDSSELSLLMESSTAALRHISDSLLDGDVKKGFDELINKYNDHISSQLKDYQSVDEEFNHALASLSIDAKQNLEKFRDSEGISADNRLTIAIKEKLGSVNHSDNTKKEYADSIYNLFVGMNSQNYRQTLDKIQEQYVAHTSGYSDDDNIKDYIQNRSGGLFEQLSKSWSAIVNLSVVE